LFVLAVILTLSVVEWGRIPKNSKLHDLSNLSATTFRISKEPLMPEGHVYILGSTTGTLYTGVTSKFDQRLFEHKSGIKSAFASKYKRNRLLLYERYVDIRSAIAREKEIKGWTRAKKLALISQSNPDFKDLAAQHGWLMLHPKQNIADQK
jgi:putative endonuclease